MSEKEMMRVRVTFSSFFSQISLVLSPFYVSMRGFFSFLHLPRSHLLSFFHLSLTKDEQARCYQRALSIQQRIKLIDTRQHALARTHAQIRTFLYYNTKGKNLLLLFFLVVHDRAKRKLNK
jgi:hypothetical protein